jgi:subtilisin family serine protease
MREYNVALHRHVNYDEFWEQIENETSGLSFLPDRAVDIANNRDGSLRQCHYYLTDEEAELIRQDERVYCVEIPPEQRDDITIGHRATQSSDFTKVTASTGAYVNWGLLRSNYPSNVYGTGTSPALGVNYDYTLDGTGVDVVIQDSGLQVDHPEFQDSKGVSRVQQIDWGTVSGLFTQNANHYRDYHGHGTHVAGIVAGKTFGWAKNAKIYSLKVSGLEGSGDSGTGVSVTYAFDAIKIWHAAKPIQASTGCKRPTVVNMSWGYSHNYNSVSALTYRGTSVSSSYYTDSYARYQALGLVNETDSPGNGTTYSCNVRVSSVDVDLQELIDAGVIVCIAAGNNCSKIDVSGGADYNNNVTTNASSNVYYHRGMSPYDRKAIIVGCMDKDAYDSTYDQRTYFSCTGPGVDIYAPGSYIMSATSTTNELSGQSYYLNSSYKQVNISGTSMASPQVAGVAALLLQMNPTASAAAIKSAIVNRAPNLIQNGGGNSGSYLSQYRGTMGGPTGSLYSKLNGGNNLILSGSLIIKSNINFI